VHAQEWGFDVLGLDLRVNVVEKLRPWSYLRNACHSNRCMSPAASTLFSMADVLEHMPFPGPALAHARKLVKQDGTLFVSMPNLTPRFGV
jgi:hypothetical protein